MPEGLHGEEPLRVEKVPQSPLADLQADFLPFFRPPRWWREGNQRRTPLCAIDGDFAVG